MRALVSDPNAEHEIRIRMLGNSSVFVTCKCLDLKRSRWKGRTTRTNRAGYRDRYKQRIAPEWKSLGDFPVDGGSIQPLIDAYNKHLEEVNGAP